MSTHSLASPGQAAHPFAFSAISSGLYNAAAKMLRAVSGFLIPTEEPIAPRHLQGMMALMRRADDIESTQPEVAAELRWIAASYCYA